LLQFRPRDIGTNRLRSCLSHHAVAGILDASADYNKYLNLLKTASATSCSVSAAVSMRMSATFA
jgi:hypothetical protein